MRRPRREDLRARPAFLAFVVALSAGGLFVVDALVERAAGGPGDPDSVRPGPSGSPDGAPAGRYRQLDPRLRPPPAAAAVPPDPDSLAAESPGRIRSLAAVYERRAYPGAPPWIPHPVDAPMATGDACLTCHRYGGWAPKLDAWSPPTPHPELVGCTQCHVARIADGEFRATSWRTPEPPKTGGAALSGSPPPVPHTLEMRSDCLACHAGPAAPAEIRTAHPERVGCLQCHVPTEATQTWRRPAEGSQ